MAEKTYCSQYQEYAKSLATSFRQGTLCSGWLGGSLCFPSLAAKSLVKLIVEDLVMKLDHRRPQRSNFPQQSLCLVSFGSFAPFGKQIVSIV